MTAEPVEPTPGSRTSDMDLAALWARSWYLERRRTLWTVISWLPIINIFIVLSVEDGVLALSLVCALLWGLLFAIYYVQSIRTVGPVIEALRPLSHFSDEETVRAVLGEADADLRQVARLTAPETERLLRRGAQRVFARLDEAGCGDGHQALCRHRRDVLSWNAWIEMGTRTTFEEPTTPS